MSTPAKLIEQAQAFGARLWVEDNRLEIDIPLVFPDTLIALLRENKTGLLTYLHNMEVERSPEIQPAKTRGSVRISVADELERMMARA